MELPRFGLFDEDPEKRAALEAAKKNGRREEQGEIIITNATEGKEVLVDGDIVGKEQIARSVTNKNLEQVQELLEGKPDLGKIKKTIALLEDHMEYIEKNPTDKKQDGNDMDKMKESLSLLEIAEKVLSRGNSFEIAKKIMSAGGKEYLRGLSLKLREAGRLTADAGRDAEIGKVKEEMAAAINTYENILAVDEEAVKDVKSTIEMLKDDLERM